MVGGVSTSHFLLQFNPPRLLQFSWGEGEDETPSEVTFELQTEGDRVRLTITHTLLGENVIANVAGGWHSHLTVLGDRLAGIEPRPFWPLLKLLEAGYEKQFPGD